MSGVISKDVPVWLWRSLRWTAVLLMVTAVGGIGLISAGLFDPQPVGPEIYERQLSMQAIAPQSRHIVWLPDLELPDAYTLRLTAARQSGEEDVAYGLVIGDEGWYWVTAVSPLGYVAVWRESIVDSRVVVERQETGGVYLPWQMWPHVRGGQATNEIWVDVVDGRVGVRVNREMLWQEDIGLAGKRVGLIGGSFGGAAVIEFQALQQSFPDP